jgi:hypothetical protein
VARSSDGQNTVPIAGPGQLHLKVIRSNHREFDGLSSVYWMEPAVKQRDKLKDGPQAWLDPILLTPAGMKEPTRVTPMHILLQDGKLEPDMVPPGGTVKASVRVSAPKHVYYGQRSSSRPGAPRLLE